MTLATGCLSSFKPFLPARQGGFMEHGGCRHCKRLFIFSLGSFNFQILFSLTLLFLVHCVRVIRERYIRVARGYLIH